MVPGPLGCHSFLHRITTSEEATSGYSFPKVENVESFAKTVITVGGNYFAKRFIVDF